MGSLKKVTNRGNFSHFKGCSYCKHPEEKIWRILKAFRDPKSRKGLQASVKEDFESKARRKKLDVYDYECLFLVNMIFNFCLNESFFRDYDYVSFPLCFQSQNTLVYALVGLSMYWNEMAIVGIFLS